MESPPKQETEIPQLKVKETPVNCPVLPPCPVCPPKPKPWQVCLKALLVLGAGLVLALIILVGSGLRITRKESLLDIWLASRRGITPTPEVIEPTSEPFAGWLTYTSEKHGFSFRYPESYQKYLIEHDSGVEIECGCESLNWFLVGKVSSDLKPEDWWVKYGKKTFNGEGVHPYAFKVITTEEKKIGSNEMFVVEAETKKIENESANPAVPLGPLSFKVYITSSGKNLAVITEYLLGKEERDLFDQILSTFKFLDKESGGSNTEEEVSSGEKARLISFEKIAGWLEYSSPTGYSIQHPSSFQPSAGGEEKRDGACYKYFNNNAGGILMAKVVPYDGGSRRQLYGTESGYTYQYEEAVIQGQKSLMIEKGPIGDSGSESAVVVPVGNKALILSWSNRAKNSSEFVNLLKSIKLGESLDLTKCWTL
ncbi:MAG TPA: hypothetical protein VMW04_04710 [Patescibacteria group bacterium]|nr:hypothetical protein [Patescibacteria group bacterium]